MIAYVDLNRRYISEACEMSGLSAGLEFLNGCVVI
jgi:hypothetical protein